MKLLVLLTPFFASCAWMEDYTAADAMRRIMPDRGGVFVSRGDGDISGSGKGYRTDEDTIGGYLEWDILTQRVIVEGFGKFREDLSRMPVEDAAVPEILDSLVAFQAATLASFEDLDEKMDEESEEVQKRLESIEEQVDAETFIDKLWVKLGLGGGVGVAILAYLLKGGKKPQVQA